MSKTARLMEVADKIRNLFWKKVVGSIKYKSPLDSMALFGHYPLTAFVFLGVCICLLKGYMEEDLVECKSLGGGLEELKDPLRLQVCLQYSHIELDDEGHTGSVLSYTWQPYVFAVVAFIMFIPRLIRKSVGHESLERFMSSLKNVNDDEEANEKVRDYCFNSVGSHRGVMLASLKVSLACLVCDLVCIFILDTASFGTFMYGFSYYPYIRDMANYNRLFSRAFPPTTKCSITPVMQITLQNTVNYGCSLPLNWYYEKIYIALYTYIFVLVVISVISILIDLWALRPGHRQKWVSMGGLCENWSHRVARKWTNDELYILKHFKNIVGQRTFVKILGDVVTVQDNVTEVVIRDY